MTGLQEAFYIVGLIFMGLMLLLMIALAAAVFVIRAKVNKIHDTIEAKINTVTSLAGVGGELAAAVTGSVTRKAKRALGRR